jgi:hypothetical protein
MELKPTPVPQWLKAAGATLIIASALVPFFSNAKSPQPTVRTKILSREVALSHPGLQKLRESHSEGGAQFGNYHYAHAFKVERISSSESIAAVVETAFTQIDSWSQPESIEFGEAGSATRRSQAHICAGSSLNFHKGNLDQMGEKELEILDERAFQIDELPRSVVIETGFEANSFGDSRFCALYDRENQELLLLGTGYAE